MSSAAEGWLSPARLLSAAVEALAAPRCSPPARDAVLDLLESLLDSDDAAIAAIVQRHTGPVLEALKALVLRALSPGKSAAAKTPAVRLRASRRAKCWKFRPLAQNYLIPGLLVRLCYGATL